MWNRLGRHTVLLSLAVASIIPAAHAAPPTVTVGVTATDTSGGVLRYRWASTDGTIANVNAASTTWILPNGPGLHFAYVLVSNAKGGYAERRVAVNTDVIGSALVVPPAINWAAPPRVAQQGDYYRKLINGDNHYLGGLGRDIYFTGIPVFLRNPSSGQRFPAVGNVLTDLAGQALIPGVPAGNNYALNCSVDGGTTFLDCNFASINIPLNIPAAATTDYSCGGCAAWPSGFTSVPGRMLLQDGGVCGITNEFFGIRSAATATLRDAANRVLAGPSSLDEFGNFSLLYNFNLVTPANVLLQCEGAAPITVALPTVGVIDKVVSGVRAPVISSMSATFNGSAVGLFLPPPSGLPSDILTRADAYLAEKGVDSRIGACRYYLSIGAVKTCSAAGVPTGAINFQDWKRQVKIDSFRTVGGLQSAATYINKVDLNLTRRHVAVTYSPTQTAAYVCNHLGPAFKLVTPQADINTAIANAVAGKNLVACVAMDYAITTNVNGNKPFIRFMIFGPSGELLPSINLDGRREKFVPGTCVVCHGGDHYAGKFPENGTGFPNVGGHFVPYDVGNFQFSSAAGLTQASQEEAIYNLNQYLLNAGPTLAERELIAGWYATSHVLNKTYVPVSWQSKGATAISFYREVQAHTCRSCHVALTEGYNFDHYVNIDPAANNGRVNATSVITTVCGGSAQIERDFMMPNSLVTFDRFWLSYHNTAGLPDQPTILSQFYAASGAPCGTGLGQLGQL